MGIKLTNSHINFWKNRKNFDWKADHQSEAMVNHPHRTLIVWMLKSIPFVSLWEIGCGGGSNLIRIVRELGGKQVGGSDVSEEAIKVCRETFKGGLFHVESGKDLMMSDNSVDIILSDMCLIYVDPFQIDTYLKEMKRVGRNYVVLCEFNSKSWWKRQVARLGGYHVYDYRKRLEKLGFFDVVVQHIAEQYWPGTDKNTEFRAIITARIPKSI